MFKMYVIDFNPTILEIGFLKIRWYALIFALGFVVFYLILRHIAKKKLIEGLDKEKAELFVVYSIIGVVAGSRIFYFLFYNIGELFTNPLEILMIWHAGLSFHGGLIGFILSTILFSRRHRIGVWKLLDISAVVAIFGLMLGRIGNLINGELAGTPFDGPWCAVFPLYDTVCRHPYPVYAFISHLLLLIYLLLIIYFNRDKLKKFIGKRIISANFLIGYGVLRIITDIWKVDDMFLGVKTGQWLSLVMIILGVWLLWKRK
ncbi:prolipoprotein diacylglyceryl transferase [Candidatus Woesearchaeota archaeon]|nr:prolipoprotein diacylglyceryl transferase [Candidatus Woesearchaeota archaeon]